MDNKLNNTKWMALPEELRLSHHSIKHLSLNELTFLFNKADEKGVLNQFAELLWDIVSLANQDKPSLQECLSRLEESKRRLGRAYCKTEVKTLKDRARKYYLAMKYNELEWQIAWMADEFELNRTSKPYVLEVKL